MVTKELAGSLISNRAGEILLLHRNTSSLSQWELPGGKVEQGESLEQTTIREAKEELGVDIEIVQTLGNAHFEQIGTDWSYTWFKSRILDNQVPTINEPDTFDDLAYWDVDTLRAMTEDISPNVINLLKVIK